MSATRDEWRTAIACGDADSVLLRGYDLLQLVGKVSFAEAWLLLATGELPPPGHARLLDAMMVSVLDHGIVIASGTPGGVGHARKPPRYLTAGQRMVTEIDGLGRLDNLTDRRLMPEWGSTGAARRSCPVDRSHP